MTPDEFGTDRESLVPMDLSPEPADYSEPEDGSAEEVTAPTADLSGARLADGDDELSDADFDEDADLAWLHAHGDRDHD